MHTEKTSKTESQPAANRSTQPQSNAVPEHFQDNRQETIAQRQLQAMADQYTSQTGGNQPVIQRLVVGDLKGRNKFLYDKVAMSMSLYPAQLAALALQAADIPDLTQLVTTFLAGKEQERKAEAAAKKAASAKKHQEDVEKAQAAAAAAAAERKRVEEARLAAEEAERARKAEEARLAAEAAAAEAAAKAAERARLIAKFEAGKHKLLTIADIEGYINLGWHVNHGEEYDEKNGRNALGEKVHNYGIYININPGGGPAMTTHFHVHDGTPHKGVWDAHFKVGMGAAANQGMYVSQAEATRLFGLLVYDPPAA